MSTQGDGAWEPKPGAFKRGKQGTAINGLPLPLPAWAVGPNGEESAPAQAASAADLPAPPRGAKRERDRTGGGADEVGACGRDGGWGA